ncbi:MAG TPA: ABC transporter ATP-binding protein/permease [Rhodopila sp.]|uniref:ABCB family ABC transporter ATP-binding protein/permease n=1 Tax=Rhodopila sp. TaxID=2480087 RepID=UPI002C200D9E|nr:ABC transporter ATP-binding protein/permease [Rhodopila sp.]HVY15450.1 ABC transporter ATP-binding protein/permease [Rhodopila sp.]
MRRSSPPPAPTIQIPGQRSTWQTILSLLPYLWPAGNRSARVRVVVALVFMLLAKVATVYVPILYGRVIDALAPKDAAAFVIPLALILAYGGVRVASAAFGELRDALFASVQQRAVRQLALRTFRHLHALSLRFHLDRQTGGLGRIIDRGTLGMQSVLRLAVFNVAPTALELVLVTAIIWRLFDWRYAAVTFAAVVLYVAFTAALAGKRGRYRRTMNDTDNDASSKSLDSLLNYETVKYFNNEAHESRRYDEALARYERAAVRVQVSLNMLNLGQALIIALGLTAIMLLAASDMRLGWMTVGKFVVVNTYLMQLYQPLNFLGVVYMTIKQGLVDMEQMFALLRMEREVVDKPGALSLPASLSDGAAGEVVFEDVRFGYQPNRAILKGVSFRVPAGGKLAIVGPTGAGKSTISRLLFRFYDVSGGRVLIDGHDVRDVTQDSLRQAIGVVPQDTVLFNDTIRYNIAYGRPGATQAEIEHAARLAQVHDFVLGLPDGYDTKVGERGLKLSGGEKQRVAIARTILKDPRILILDEATSALDTRTEQDIQAALRAVAQQRTTLVIAHRLSTVVDADEIVVLQDGAIAERGTHAALLARHGLYARMWALQSIELGLDPTGAASRDLPADEAKDRARDQAGDQAGDQARDRPGDPPAEPTVESAGLVPG